MVAGRLARTLGSARTREEMGGEAPCRPVIADAASANKFFYYQKEICYSPAMDWRSLPYEPRKVQATEARLDAIYNAARLGLKGDNLALAAGLLPSEYRRLCQFDPLAELAELKGRADGEMVASRQLHEAAAAGDAKAALEVLKHVHGWTARTAIDVNVEQTISIKHALEMAQQRVIEGTLTHADHAILPAGGDGADVPLVDASPERRSA